MKVGIIGAMELEIELLKEHMTLAHSEEHAGMVFFEGTLQDTQDSEDRHACPVVVVKCGIGKVNAAICVQILADLFQVTHIINTGVAGALAQELNIGDILVSVDALQHDMDVTALGYPLGQIPEEDVLSFTADDHMVAAALAAGKAMQDAGIHMMTGRVVSGDQFISGSDKKNWLISSFQGACCEMEGGAIAQAASKNGLPFVILRAISDKADGSAQVDYPVFEREAAKNCAMLTEAMLKQLN